jgi:hypothetical protein
MGLGILIGHDSLWYYRTTAPYVPYKNRLLELLNIRIRIQTNNYTKINLAYRTDFSVIPYTKIGPMHWTDLCAVRYTKIGPVHWTDFNVFIDLYGYTIKSVQYDKISPI